MIELEGCKKEYVAYRYIYGGWGGSNLVDALDILKEKESRKKGGTFRMGKYTIDLFS